MTTPVTDAPPHCDGQLDLIPAPTPEPGAAMQVIDNAPIERIAENPLNVRRDVGDVTDLAASIAEVGLMEPLVVAPRYGAAKDDPQPFVLIAGHRRLAALRQAGIERTTIIVKTNLVSEADHIEAMLVENLQRVDITPVEEGQAYKQLLAFDDVTAESIAKRTGRSVATVKARVTLADLPNTVQDKVHAGDVTLTSAMTVAEFLNDPAALEEIEAALGGPNFEYTAERLRRKRKRDKAEAETRAQLAHDGVTVIETPEHYPWGAREKPLTHLGCPLDQHGDCPGHAAVITHDGTAQFICSDPATHHPIGDAADEPTSTSARDSWEFTQQARKLGYNGALTDEQRATVAASLAEKARLAEVLATAAEVRWKHVDGLLEPGVKPPKNALALALACLIYEHQDTETFEEALPEQPDDATREDESKYSAWFFAQVLALKPDQLGRLALMTIRQAVESELTAPWRTEWHSDPTYRPYFDLLEGSGYALTAEETARLTPPADEES